MTLSDLLPQYMSELRCSYRNYGKNGQFEWDQPLPRELQQEWVNLQDELVTITKTCIS
jgi:hypothetical protein